MSEARAIRIMPLPVVHPRWETELSEYPEIIQVSFSNGKVRTYSMADQPKPNLISRREFNRLYKESGGYRPKHAKKDR